MITMLENMSQREDFPSSILKMTFDIYTIHSEFDRSLVHRSNKRSEDVIFDIFISKRGGKLYIFSNVFKCHSFGKEQSVIIPEYHKSMPAGNSPQQRLNSKSIDIFWQWNTRPVDECCGSALLKYF